MTVSTPRFGCAATQTIHFSQKQTPKPKHAGRLPMLAMASLLTAGVIHPSVHAETEPSKPALTSTESLPSPTVGVENKSPDWKVGWTKGYDQALGVMRELLARCHNKNSHATPEQQADFQNHPPDWKTGWSIGYDQALENMQPLVAQCRKEKN